MKGLISQCGAQKASLEYCLLEVLALQTEEDP